MEMEQVMAEQNYVELRQVNKKYKDFQASDDINFGIQTRFHAHSQAHH